MLSTLLLKFILLSCSCFLFFAVHSLYRCVDIVVVSVEKKAKSTLYGGYVALYSLKNDLFQWNRNALPCSITGNDL